MSNLMKKFVAIATGLTLATMLFPVIPAQAITAEELQTQIDDLLATLAGLQDQLTALTGEPATTGGAIVGVPSDFTFDKALYYGMSDTDVKYLQIVLNSDEDTQLAVSGAGSPGSETNYFGPITKAGAIKFQEKYADDVLAYWGLTSGTGYVGQTTRDKLNSLLETDGEEPVGDEYGTGFEFTLSGTPVASDYVYITLTDAENVVQCAADVLSAPAGVTLNSLTDSLTTKFGNCANFTASSDGNVITVVTTGVDCKPEVDVDKASGSTLSIVGAITEGATTDPGEEPAGEGLTVALADDNPASATIVADSVAGKGAQAQVPFLKVKFTNGDASEVKVTTLKFTRKGISSDTDLSNVYLYEGDTRLAEMTSFSSKVVTFTDSTGLFAVPDGESKTITLKADLVNQADSGKTIGFNLAASTDIVSDASAINGTFSLAGNLMSTANVTDLGKLTVTHSSYPASVDPDLDAERELWRFTIKASSQKIEVSYLKFTMIGTADADDFRDLNFYVGGIKVAGPIEMASDKTVTFDLTGDPIVLTSGQQKTATVNAKVVGGAGRDFYLSFQNSSDIIAYDAGYGIYLKPNGEDVFGIVKASAATDINQGTLTTTRSSDTLSGNVSLAGTDIALACFDFSAAGENIKITSLPAHITLSSTTKNVSNVYLSVDGSQVGSTDSTVLGNGAEDIAWGSFGNAFVVQSGEIAKVCIKADIVAASGTDLVKDETIQASLETPSADNAKRMVSGSTFKTSLYDGFQLTIKSGAVSAAKNLAMPDAATTSPSGVGGSTGAKIASFTITSGAGEGVNVSQIVLVDNTINLYDYFQNLVLKDSAGTQIGSTIGSLTDDTGITYSFTPSETLSIAASAQKVFNVFADIKSGAATGTISAPVKVDAIYAYGIVTSQSANDTDTDPALQNVYIASNASLTVTKDAGAPAAAILVMSDTAQIMSKFRFEETTGAEDAEVTQIVLTNAMVSAATSSVVNITIESGDFSASKVALIAAGTVTFDLTADPWVIPAATYKVLIVKADVAQYPACTSGGTHTFKLAATSVTAQGAISKGAISKPASPVGDIAMYTYRTKLTASGVKTAYTAAARGVGTEALQFKLAAHSNYDATLHQIEFTNSGSDTSPGTGDLKIYDSGNLSTPLVVLSNIDLTAATTTATINSASTTIASSTLTTTVFGELSIGGVFKIASEYMLVTKLTVDTATVIRAWAGSAAATHSADANITDGDIHFLAQTGVVVPIPESIQASASDYDTTGYSIAANDSKTFIVRGDTSSITTGSQSLNIKINADKIGWRDAVQTSNITSLTPGLPIEGSVTFN